METFFVLYKFENWLLWSKIVLNRDRDIRVSNDGNGCLFITERNTPILVRSIHYTVSRYALKAGLPEVSPHTLRHTLYKSLIDQGVGIEQVAYLAGHDSLETTKRYIQPSENDLRKAVQTISEKR